MSVKTVIEAVPSAMELEDAMGVCQAANADAVAAEIAWSAADAARHAAWARLQLVETALARELRGATAPPEIVRITTLLEAVERSVDLVFRPHDESWIGPVDSVGQIPVPVTP